MKVNLGEIVGLYREAQKKESGTDDYTFYGAYVGAGKILLLHQLSVSDVTTGNKSLLIGYQEGDGDIKWLKKVDIANHYSNWMNGQLILIGG